MENTAVSAVANPASVAEEMPTTASASSADAIELIQQQVRALVLRRKELLDTIAANEEKLKFLPAQRGRYIIEGVNVEAIERGFRLKIRECEQELERVRDQINVQYQRGFDLLKAERNTLWARFFATAIEPCKTSFCDLITQVARLSDAIIAVLSATEPAVFDRRCVAWDKFLDEIGAPSNYKAASSLAEATRGAFTEHLKDALKDLQLHENRIREAIGMSVLKTESEWRNPPKPATTRFRTPEEIFGRPQPKPDPTTPTGYTL